MSDVVLGIISILIGALFCFRGYLTMRVIIPIWGAFAGFILGAGVVAAWTNDGFLTSVLSWTVGIVVGLIFGLIAYLYFVVAIVLAMSTIGFALGTSLMVAIGVNWSWLIVLGGVALGTLLAMIAIAGNLPMMLLTVLTALAGASTIVGGITLLAGTVQSEQLTEAGATTDQLHDDWWWYAIFGGLAVAGILVQIASMERISGTMRESWEASARGSATTA